MTEKEHRYDPNPYYYLYVLYYLSVMDGNKEDEKNIETYRKLSYTYANNRGNRITYEDGYCYYYASQTDNYFLYRAREDGKWFWLGGEGFLEKA